jgi:glycosyltransferase involved in cell wall biosynthesis
VKRALIVHVITRLDLGGAQENTLATCRGLRDRGYRVVLIHGPGGLLDPEAESLERRVVPQLGRAVDPMRDTQALATLTGHLAELRRQQSPEGGFVVHTHTSKAGLLGRIAARRWGLRPVIHSIHGFPFFEGQASWARAGYTLLERWAGSLTDGFISVSRANLAEAQARGIVRPHHLARVVRSGFDLEPFRAAAHARAVARRELEVPEDRILWISIANLKPQKDPLTLVAAVDLARRRLPDLEVWYAGDGPLRGVVEAEIRRRGLSHHLRLLGWRRDVPRLLAACDGMILTSRFEGLPRTVVQARAAGRPVVASRVDGTGEILRDGCTGRLVEPGSVPGFARALMEVSAWSTPVPATDAELQGWSEHTLIEAQIRLYEEILARTDGGVSKKPLAS